MEALYPHKIDLGKLILGEEHYSYTFTIVNPEGLSESSVKLALEIIYDYFVANYRIRLSHWYYFAGTPALFNFHFQFWESPAPQPGSTLRLTLGEFAQEIREFALDYYLDLQVKDAYIWKPSKWPLILLGALGFLTLGLCLRKEE